MIPSFYLQKILLNYRSLFDNNQFSIVNTKIYHLNGSFKLLDYCLKLSFENVSLIN